MKSVIASPLGRALKWAALALSPVLALFVYIALDGPGLSGVLAYTKAPDGTDCLVTQGWNGWDNGGEPYTVSFYSRKPGGPWQFQYLDHEAGGWWSCRMELEAETHEVKIYNGKSLHRRVPLHPTLHVTEATPPFFPEGIQ